MKVLVTGSSGFVGKNLVSTLENTDGFEVLTFDRENSLEDLENYTKVCDFVVHLAGINRPENPEDFYKGNAGLTESLCELLEEAKNHVPILISSSIQAELDNDYGQSKKEGENHLLAYGNRTGAQVMIYRFPNLFGKWTRPFYNSVVATWSYQIARDEEIQINDPSYELNLVYIDDLILEILRAMEGKGHKVHDVYYSVPVSYFISLGQLADTLKSFRDSRNNRYIANMSDDLTRKLYSTYLNYLPTDAFSYPLVMHQDDRGSFTEFVKSDYAGQVSVNVSKPGVTKGEHWHHSKNEKFLVVKGKGVIKFRDIYSDEIIEYFVSDESLEVVDIPTGYTHNIINLGDNDMVTIMWVNEPFDPNTPDTFFMEVEK
ncbi:NAD-dependent epimerase/dehydratase family protein [Erysipelothrix urinaevulpis]|uniref:polysaccharide biosynthesis C-terminal domain-containing protein n=1 Tax=Erysipelothrix urinaevulpis TaxID=2683717 RepID=UPI00135B8D4B|nr:NAD-dependent epimerase/dehydratase family protein [Erysipelothrix urinaevulpis]